MAATGNHEAGAPPQAASPGASRGRWFDLSRFRHPERVVEADATNGAAGGVLLSTAPRRAPRDPSTPGAETWTPSEDKLQPVRDLQSPMESLVSQLAPAIAADEYSVIVGDDTSGRVPALVLREAINRYRVGRGLPKIPIVFLPGGGGRDYKTTEANQEFALRADMIRDMVRNHPGGPGRALLVTDNVSSGNTINYSATNLASLGLAVDVAAVGMNGTRSSRSSGLPDGSRFYQGSDTWTKIDGRHDISGVYKLPTIVLNGQTRNVTVAARVIGSQMAVDLSHKLRSAAADLGL